MQVTTSSNDLNDSYSKIYGKSEKGIPTFTLSQSIIEKNKKDAESGVKDKDKDKYFESASSMRSSEYGKLPL